MRLRALLNGETRETPDAWIVSRVCEEFRCLPSQAVRELEDEDAELVFAVLEMRAFARAKAEVERPGLKAGDLNMRDPMIRRVFELEAEALKQT